jgi:DNA-binding transcriptional MerR regulator
MLRIGELARRAGVATSAVRFYESKGLVEPDGRVAGQRRYSEAAVERLRMVVLLRKAGLSCDDIAVALDPTPEGGRLRRERAARRAAELRDRLTTTLSALVVVQHASVCTRDADDDRCVEEIGRQRDSALQEAEALLARVTIE